MTHVPRPRRSNGPPRGIVPESRPFPYNRVAGVAAQRPARYQSQPFHRDEKGPFSPHAARQERMIEYGMRTPDGQPSPSPDDQARADTKTGLAVVHHQAVHSNTQARPTKANLLSPEKG
jgi:hypothetical protein